MYKFCLLSKSAPNYAGLTYSKFICIISPTKIYFIVTRFYFFPILQARSKIYDWIHHKLCKKKTNIQKNFLNDNPDDQIFKIHSLINNYNNFYIVFI